VGIDKSGECRVDRVPGSVSGNPSRIAKFPDLGLDNSLQLINPGGESLGVCFPGDAFAQLDHPITIFRRHGSVDSKHRF